MKMTRLPGGLLSKFLVGEHAMRHQNGLWNSIWSDQMIETTVMRYGHSMKKHWTDGQKVFIYSRGAKPFGT